MNTFLKYMFACIVIAAVMAGFPFSAAGEDAAAIDETAAPILPENIMDADEAGLFGLINAARKDPLAMAEAIGLDRDQVLKNLPELNDILLNGLPELTFSDRLYASAGDHGRDMLARNYYAYDSLDGRTPAQRMTEAGYAAAAAGEALGLMFFNNFIDPDRAVFQIFQNIYGDELSPEWEGPRNILNPDFEDLGTAIGAGIYQFHGVSGNVYMAVCDFGKSVETYELALLVLVNQFRDDPGAVIRSLGLDPAAVAEMFPEYAAIFDAGLPPLAFDSRLYRAAEVQVRDMIAHQYWGHVSPEGVTPVMRIRNQGYAPVWAAESKTRVSTCDAEIPPENIVFPMFRNMVSNAFRTAGFRDANILSEKAMDAGFRSLATRSQALSGICGDQVHLAVGDFGAPAVAESILCGVVYADINADGLYDAEEGAAGLEITVRAAGAAGATRTITTDPAGAYAAHLAPGRYRISMSAGDEEVVQWIDVQAKRTWLAVSLPDTVPDSMLTEEVF